MHTERKENSIETIAYQFEDFVAFWKLLHDKSAKHANLSLAVLVEEFTHYLFQLTGQPTDAAKTKDSILKTKLNLLCNDPFFSAGLKPFIDALIKDIISGGAKLKSFIKNSLEEEIFDRDLVTNFISALNNNLGIEKDAPQQLPKFRSGKDLFQTNILTGPEHKAFDEISLLAFETTEKDKQLLLYAKALKHAIEYQLGPNYIGRAQLNVSIIALNNGDFEKHEAFLFAVVETIYSAPTKTDYLASLEKETLDLLIKRAPYPIIDFNDRVIKIHRLILQLASELDITSSKIAAIQCALSCNSCRIKEYEESLAFANDALAILENLSEKSIEDQQLEKDIKSRLTVNVLAIAGLIVSTNQQRADELYIQAKNLVTTIIDIDKNILTNILKNLCVLASKTLDPKRKNTIIQDALTLAQSNLREHPALHSKFLREMILVIKQDAQQTVTDEICLRVIEELRNAAGKLKRDDAVLNYKKALKLAKTRKTLLATVADIQHDLALSSLDQYDEDNYQLYLIAAYTTIKNIPIKEETILVLETKIIHSIVFGVKHFFNREKLLLKLSSNWDKPPVQVLQSFSRAMELINCLDKLDAKSYIDFIKNIIEIADLTKNNDKKDIYYDRLLNLATRKSISSHYVARALFEMGLCAFCRGNYSQYIENGFKAIAMTINLANIDPNIPDQNPVAALTLQKEIKINLVKGLLQIAIVKLGNNTQDDAVEFFDKAMNLLQSLDNIDDPTCHDIIEKVNKIVSLLKDDQERHGCYQHILPLLEARATASYGLALLQKDAGVCLWKLGHFSEFLTAFFAALETIKKIPNKDASIIALEKITKLGLVKGICFVGEKLLNSNDNSERKIEKENHVYKLGIQAIAFLKTLDGLDNQIYLARIFNILAKVALAKIIHEQSKIDSSALFRPKPEIAMMPESKQSAVSFLISLIQTEGFNSIRGVVNQLLYKIDYKNFSPQEASSLLYEIAKANLNCAETILNIPSLWNHLICVENDAEAKELNRSRLWVIAGSSSACVRCILENKELKKHLFVDNAETNFSSLVTIVKAHPEVLEYILQNHELRCHFLNNKISREILRKELLKLAETNHQSASLIINDPALFFILNESDIQKIKEVHPALLLQDNAKKLGNP